ncbi:hypothetical protein ACFQFR_33065 [Streptomyces goshikiensis]
MVGGQRLGGFGEFHRGAVGDAVLAGGEQSGQGCGCEELGGEGAGGRRAGGPQQGREVGLPRGSGPRQQRGEFGVRGARVGPVAQPLVRRPGGLEVHPVADQQVPVAQHAREQQRQPVGQGAVGALRGGDRPPGEGDGVGEVGDLALVQPPPVQRQGVRGHDGGRTAARPARRRFRGRGPRVR